MNGFEEPLIADYGKLTDGTDAAPLWSGVGTPSLSGAAIVAPDVAQLVRTAPPGYQLHQPMKLSLLQLQALGSCALGWQVLVESTDGDYVGYLCWMLDHCHRLGLEQVCRPGSGLRRVGLVLVYYRCVTAVTLIAKRANSARRLGAQRTNVVEERKGRSLLMKKVVPLHLEKRKEEEEEVVVEEPPPLPPPSGRMTRPNTWVVVDTPGEEYSEAVRHLSTSERVAVSCFGQSIGRWGQLAWLCVATTHTVYLFDAATLGLGRLFYGHDNKKKRLTNKLDPAPLIDGEEKKQINETSKVGPAMNEATMAVSKETVTGSDGDEVESNSVCKVETTPAEVLSTSVICDDGKETEQVITENSAPSNSVVNPNETCASETVVGTANPETMSADATAARVLAATSTEQSADEPLSLARLLTDPGVEVVMHDARNLCDLLYHQIGLQINTLFDTQACEVYLHITLHRGDCPAFLPPLGPLLIRRLGLRPPHLLYEGINGRDPSTLFERPVSRSLLAGLASSCLFLAELREAQLSDVMADLRQLTTVHAHAHMLRDDVTRNRVEQHVVPAGVQQLGRRTVLRSQLSEPRAAWGRGTAQRSATRCH